MAAKGANLVLGVVLLVLGILVLLGELSVGWLVPFIGVALIVVGVLVLLKVLSGGTLIGIAAIVVGVLLLPQFGILDIPGQLARLMNVVVGILLVVFGVVKISGR